METYAWPTAVVFVFLELCYSFIFSIVAFRLRTHDQSEKISSLRYAELTTLFLCSAISLASLTHAIDTKQDAFAVFALAQFLCDSICFYLTLRAAKTGLRRGPASCWRAVLSSVASALSMWFITTQTSLRALELGILTLRLLWVLVNPLAHCFASRAQREKIGAVCEVDEMGLLLNRTNMLNQFHQDNSRVYLAFAEEEEEEEEDNDISNTDAMSQSLLDFGGPSFIQEQQQQPPVLRSSSFLRAVSPDLITNVPSNVTWGDGQQQQNPVSPIPAPSTSEARRPNGTSLSSSLEVTSLPDTVQMICVRQVFTTSGIPLNVYVLRLNGNRVCVHRYGDFRALHKRFIIRAYHEARATAPHFPVRRLMRKLLPQVLGGWYGEDEDFISHRAQDLERWIQTVLEFIRTNFDKTNVATRKAMLDFLSPLGEGNIDVEGEDEVVQTAVRIFSDLNMV